MAACDGYRKPREGDLIEPAVKLAVAKEAVSSLNLLKPEATATIRDLLDDTFVNHPRAICLEYRKAMPQLTDEEKRYAGMKANAFFSRQAYQQLSESGRQAPLAAHETTLLRATFSLRRFATVVDSKKAGITQVQYEMLNMDCPWCAANDGVIVDWNQARVLPPPECVCETANYSLTPSIDWFADID